MNIDQLNNNTIYHKCKETLENAAVKQVGPHLGLG